MRCITRQPYGCVDSENTCACELVKPINYERGKKTGRSKPTTEVATGRNFYLSLEGAYNEIQGVRVDAFDTLLHDVITILIFNTFQYVTVQLFYNFHLLFARYRFQRLLYDSASVHLQSQR